MSARRRRQVASKRVDARYERRLIADGDKSIRQAPASWTTYWGGVRMRGKLHLAEPFILMPGKEVTVRGWHGEIIFQERAPEWTITLRSYAAYITTRPIPLTARQRAKHRRR